MKKLLKDLGEVIVGRTGARQQDSNETGAKAESLAAHHLGNHGLHILARNVRYRGGELDLICRHGPCIVFVEVRLRQNKRFGGAAASVSAGKRRRVIHAAQQWLAGEGREHAARPCRFDVVLLDRLELNGLTWIKGAFDADGES